jgi:hypothetical protein
MPGLSRAARRLSSAVVTILLTPLGRGRVILRDDPAIVSEDDDGGPARG